MESQGLKVSISILGVSRHLGFRSADDHRLLDDGGHHSLRKWTVIRKPGIGSRRRLEERPFTEGYWSLGAGFVVRER